MVNLDRQNLGGRKSILGNGYEANFFVQKLVQMLTPSNGESERVIEVQRQKKGPVDDVFVKTNSGGSIYYQCRIYTDPSDDLLRALFSQFDINKSAKICLLSQSKDKFKYYEDITSLAKKFSWEEFFQKLSDNSIGKKQREAFEKLCSFVGKGAQKEKELLAYNFLKSLNIIAHNDTYSEEMAKRELGLFGYSLEQPENIFNCFRKMADNDSWLGKPVTVDILKDELKKIGISLLNPERKLQKDNNALDNSGFAEKANSKHQLLEKSQPFHSKLSFLLNFIKDFKKVPKKEFKNILKVIEGDYRLAWHFFKNLQDPEWFPLIKNNILKKICSEEADYAVKYQVLNYFKQCQGEYSDEIILLLVELAKHSGAYSVLSEIIKNIGELKPSKPSNLDPIWSTLDQLSEHQHPWVRKEIPQIAKKLSSYNLNNSLNLLKKIFLIEVYPQDVTQGGAVLSMRFQGRDNENMVFEEAARVLRELIRDPVSYLSSYKLATEVEKFYLNEEGESNEKEGDITLDHSFIWFDDPESERIDYEYERKKRIALEVERGLSELIKIDIQKAEKVITVLLDSDAEVFHLIVIRILTNNPATLPAVVDYLVFEQDLWRIYGLRAYHLQNLILKYLELNPSKLSLFVDKVNSISWKSEKKLIDYAKQDLLAAIPESLRTNEISEQLKNYEGKLKTSSKIEKMYAVTSWSGPRPSLSMEELRKKGDQDLIDLMTEISVGKNRTDPYDLAPSIGIIVSETPSRIFDILRSIKAKKIDQKFISEMVQNFIEKNKSSLLEILKIYPELNEDASWAKVELIRCIKEYCFKPEIVNLDPAGLKELKSVLFALASDADPKDDDTIRSSNPSPQEAITRGINSVRGIAVEALCALAFYIPTDKEILDIIVKMSDDKTNTVKATLIYNLKNLVLKNYDICVSIIDKFKNKRDSEIDFVLVRFLSVLDSKKFNGYMAYIKLLFNNPNTEIQSDLGELIGYRFLAEGFKLDDLVDKIVRGQIGTKDCLRSLAFIFETNLPKLFGTDKSKKILPLYKLLLQPNNEHEVVERASFMFERQELKSESLPLIVKEKIHKDLFKNKMNIIAQHHFLHYLEKCLMEQKLIPIVVSLLHEQSESVPDMFSDHLIAQKIAGILTRVVETKPKGKISKMIDQILDIGLERGWEEFYALYRLRFKK